MDTTRMDSTHPTVLEDSLRPMSAEEVIEAASRGQTLRHVRIADLRCVLDGLGQLSDPPVLRCSDCRIEAADCTGLTVTVALEIRATTFVQAASFAYATFAKPVEVAGSTFERDAIFASAQFAGLARFTGTTFAGNTSFQSAQFEQAADFEWTRFGQTVPFDFARFAKAAHFHEARFGGTVTFCMASFDNAVSFRGADCSDLLNFTGTVFGDSARLNLCNVHLRPGAQILLTIEQIGLFQRPSLRRILPTRRSAGWRFVRGLAKRLGAALERRWPSRRLIDGEDSADPARRLGAAEQYNLLRDNFRTLPGREREEDRCHYKYKDLLRRGMRGHGLWRLLDWAVYKWCLGYGIHTRRILLTGIGAVFLFAAIYWPMASQATVRNFDGNFNSLYFSVVTFTTIGYGDYAPLGYLRVPAGVEGLLGLVLTSVFTVSFARKLIR